MPTALFITFGSFALILVLARLKVPLAAAILGGAVCLAALFTRDVWAVKDTLQKAVIDAETVSMAIIVAMLLTLSESMRVAGQLERIVRLAAAALRRPAVAMAAMPMLVGLIPMPGGAIFSASMVESAAAGTEMSGARLSAINYWFRHIWEYWWPLYPAVLVATQQSRLEFGTFAAIMSPMTVFMLVCGLPIFRGTHPDLHRAGGRPDKGTKRRLLWETSSIWIIVLAWLAADALVRLTITQKTPLGDTIRKFLPVCLGLLVSLAWTGFINRFGAAAWRKILTGKTVWGMVVLAAAVMIFKFSVTHLEAARQISVELKSLHVPILLVLAILPAIAGLVTGLGIGFVGSSFPIVMPLAAGLPGSVLPYVMIAYIFGHMGMMFSPVHLCQVVSNRYFKTPFAPVYRLILWPGVATLLLGIAYFAGLKMFL